MIAIKPVSKNTTPIRRGNDMAIVTCHFNWGGYTRPRQNLRRFIRQQINQDLPLFGLELSITDEFITNGLPNWFQIKATTRNQCFQKEALINLLVNKFIPQEFTKIAWLDHDVEFSNQNWYKETSLALDYIKVVQPFTKALWTDNVGKISASAPAICIDGPQKVWRGHPGFAMASRRELFTEYGGLYSLCPLGHGDTLFACSIFDKPLFKSTEEGAGISNDDSHYLSWRNKVISYVNNSIGTINGDCYHEFHGHRNDRRYATRIKDYFPSYKHGDVFINNLGILEFHNRITNTQINRILQYFKDRKEDG